MPKSDYGSKREFTKYFILAALSDGGRRSGTLDDIDDATFDALAAEADEFWSENPFIRRRGVNLRRAAAHFFVDRNEDEEGAGAGKGFWENPHIYGNFESAKLTERSRKKGPHRLEQRNGRLRTIRQRRR